MDKCRRMEKMPNGKDKPPSYIDYRKLLILFLFSLVLSLIISIGNPRINTTYQLNDIAPSNIKSPADLSIPDSDTNVKKGEIIVREVSAGPIALDPVKLPFHGHLQVAAVEQAGEGVADGLAAQGLPEFQIGQGQGQSSATVTANCSLTAASAGVCGSGRGPDRR